MPRFRFIWLLLALLLPVQLTWASASVYCAHERNPGHSAHVGHHEHEHKADAAKKAGEAKALFDTDCGTCHSASVPLIAAAAGHVQGPVFAVAHAPPQPQRYLSAQPRAPDRPQWPRLA